MLPITLKISKILIILFAYCKNNLLGLVLDMLWLSSFHATFNVHKVMLLQNESKHHQYKSIFKSNQSHWQLVEAIHVFAAAKVCCERLTESISLWIFIYLFCFEKETRLRTRKGVR